MAAARRSAAETPLGSAPATRPATLRGDRSLPLETARAARLELPTTKTELPTDDELPDSSVHHPPLQVQVVVGDSQHASDPVLVHHIARLVNLAFNETLKELPAERVF